MPDIEMSIPDLNGLLDDLKAIPEDLRLKEMRLATSAAAEVIRKDAVQLAPVRTGDLRLNIAKRLAENSLYQITYSIGVRNSGRKVRNKQSGNVHRTNDPFYWRFLEFGTVKMTARPFLRPAFDAGVDDAIDKFTDHLNAGLARINSART